MYRFTVYDAFYLLKVLRGGDRLIDVFLKDPVHTLIQAGVKTSEGNLEAPAQEPGTMYTTINVQHKFRNVILLIYKGALFLINILILAANYISLPFV